MGSGGGGGTEEEEEERRERTRMLTRLGVTGGRVLGRGGGRGALRSGRAPMQRRGKASLRAYYSTAGVEPFFLRAIISKAWSKRVLLCASHLRFSGAHMFS